MAKKLTDLDDVLSVIADFSTMVAARFDQQDARLFRIEHALEDVKADVGVVKDRANHIYSGLDSHSKGIDDIRMDNKVRDHQHGRLERWVLELADKMNVKLKYE